jgi:two-component system chemotaxis response regulator CheY
MKVLIVDDSSMIQKAVTMMLDKLGYSSECAEHGKAAIAMLEKSDYDIILLDWNMPEMTGIEFLESNVVNAHTKGAICMMTTEDDMEKIMRALDHGAVEYIMKPFTEDILAEKIQAALEVKNAA